MKKLFQVISVLIIIVSCGTSSKNGETAIVLLYEEPISGYRVSGLFYPFSVSSETGQVELTFIPTNGGNPLLFSNVGRFEDSNLDSPSKFTGKNICDYVFGERFDGYHNGDTLICHYFDNPHPGFDSPLYYDAEFQFFDVDFDGEKEFLINDYYRGKCGNQYTVYEIGPDGFVLKDDYPFNIITNETKFIPKLQQVVVRIDDGLYDIVDLSLQTATLDDVTLDISAISQEYLGTVQLYEDNGTYTKGPDFQVNSMCWVYSCTEPNILGETKIDEHYTYYVPVGESSIIFRSSTYSGEGYHGGQMIILRDEKDASFNEIINGFYNGKRLVRNKKNDIVARAFEHYCRQH